MEITRKFTHAHYTWRLGVSLDLYWHFGSESFTLLQWRTHDWNVNKWYPNQFTVLKISSLCPFVIGYMSTKDRFRTQTTFCCGRVSCVLMMWILVSVCATLIKQFMQSGRLMQQFFKTKSASWTQKWQSSGTSVSRWKKKWKLLTRYVKKWWSK